MKFSVNWLREFVELPERVDQLAEILTLAGVEIEGVEERGANFDNVVVAQINASSQHPNADRLSVCQVDDGSGQPRQIVCGAKNYKVGDKVLLALPGAALPNGLKIKASKLRGVESQGMLCSPSELAMSEDSDGLLLLSPEAKVGAPISSVFPADTILDVEITPNRADLLSHIGLAREIAALRAKEPRLPRFDRAVPCIQRGITISAQRECPYYSARRITNVKVGPSPDWLRQKVESVGMRSINNIVDTTNLVMLEMGQPLHAFDADKLHGDINVRLANSGEQFLALDGKTYTLTERDLVIADASRAVAIAGVMGGEDTGVTEATRNVLLESAYFLPASVRRTARDLNLPSDASYRFERGVDPGFVDLASVRASRLLRELAGGEPEEETRCAGKLPTDPPDVRLRFERSNRLLGIRMEPGAADDILRRVGLTKRDGSNEESTWGIPSFRRDITREVDLIEEIVRFFGIAKIKGRARSRFTPASKADLIYDAEAKLRQRLIARGLNEARTSSLIARGAVGASFGQGAAELRNPVSEDHVALRPSLIPGLLATLERNVRAGAASVRVFELGRVFSPTDERQHLAILLCGEVASAPHWRTPVKRRLDLFDLKGAIEAIEARQILLRPLQHPEFALGTEIFRGSTAIGRAGQLSASRAAELGATSPILVAEIDVTDILTPTTGVTRFSEIDRFPAVTRDIAMIVPETLTHAAIESAIRSANEPLLERLELFDLFSGKGAENLGAGRKSLAYSLTYRDKNRTLTNDEVTVVHTRIRERLRSELGAELRE